MADKGFVVIYLKQQGKCKMKRTYIIYTKRQHKKLNKIKKDVDKVSKVCYYPIVARARKQKLKSNLKLKSKWDSGIWITTPLGNEF